MATQDIIVPDIGDFEDVSVIEILVQVGDTVAEDQSLITVESDKASMEIPSSHAGTVQAVKVAIGDKVQQGSVIIGLEVAEGAATAQPAASEPTPEPETPQKPQPAATESATTAAATTETTAMQIPEGTYDCDVLVLGAGPGGYSAAFRAADLGLNVTLVERYATLGGVCLNVGCIPSKALLHVAAVMDEVAHLKDAGVDFGKPEVSIDGLRAHKEKVVGKLTGGLAAMAKMRKVNVVQGVAQFADAHTMQVQPTDSSDWNNEQPAATGAAQQIRFKTCIIAAGSQAVHLPFLPDDPRIVDSTGALALKSVPERMLVLGGGIIGLEMATVYSTLGARLDVVEMTDGLMQGVDRDAVRVWQKHNAHRFDNIMLNTRTVAATAGDKGIEVQFESVNGGENPAAQTYDLVLQAVGRTPNGRKIAAEQAGVTISERGFVPVDIQMRTNVPHIFAIGDIVGQPMLAHKAVHEAHVAAEVIAGELQGDKKLASSAFNARVIPGVAYTDPEVAWVGLTEAQAKEQGMTVEKGVFPWSASGRAIANGRDEGFTKLLFDAETQRTVGGAIVGTHAGDMIGEVALAIEMGADAVDIGKTIHPHPTLGESLGMAAEAAHGSCTDLPPARRRRAGQ